MYVHDVQQNTVVAQYRISLEIAHRPRTAFKAASLDNGEVVLSTTSGASRDATFATKSMFPKSPLALYVCPYVLEETGSEYRPRVVCYIFALIRCSK